MLPPLPRTQQANSNSTKIKNQQPLFTTEEIHIERINNIINFAISSKTMPLSSNKFTIAVGRIYSELDGNLKKLQVASRGDISDENKENLHKLNENIINCYNLLDELKDKLTAINTEVNEIATSYNINIDNLKDKLNYIKYLSKVFTKHLLTKKDSLFRVPENICCSRCNSLQNTILNIRDDTTNINTNTTSNSYALSDHYIECLAFHQQDPTFEPLNCDMSFVISTLIEMDLLTSIPGIINNYCKVFNNKNKPIIKLNTDSICKLYYSYYAKYELNQCLKLRDLLRFIVANIKAFNIGEELFCIIYMFCESDRRMNITHSSTVREQESKFLLDDTECNMICQVFKENMVKQETTFLKVLYNIITKYNMNNAEDFSNALYELFIQNKQYYIVREQSVITFLNSINLFKNHPFNVNVFVYILLIFSELKIDYSLDNNTGGSQTPLNSLLIYILNYRINLINKVSHVSSSSSSSSSMINTINAAESKHTTEKRVHTEITSDPATPTDMLKKQKTESEYATESKYATESEYATESKDSNIMDESDILNLINSDIISNIKSNNYQPYTDDIDSLNNFLRQVSNMLALIAEEEQINQDGSNSLKEKSNMISYIRFIIEQLRTIYNN